MIYFFFFHRINNGAMRKTHYFLLESFSVGLREVQGIILTYGILLVSVLDILVLIIVIFKIQCSSGGEVHVYS